MPHSVPNATSTPPRPPSCCRTPGSMSSSRQPLDSRGASSFPLPGAAPRLLVRQRRASSCVDRFLPSCVIPLDCVGIRLVERSRMPRPRLPRSPSNSRAVRGHFLGRSIIGSSPDAAELFRCAVGSRYLRLVPGIFAAFTSAVSAVEAALRIQRELAGAEVRVRVGLNAGEPIAEDDDYFGAAVQLAARVCDRAEPGQVLVLQRREGTLHGEAVPVRQPGGGDAQGLPGTGAAVCGGGGGLMDAPPIRYCRAADGIEIGFVSFGQGPTVVLAEGADSNCERSMYCPSPVRRRWSTAASSAEAATCVANQSV